MVLNILSFYLNPNNEHGLGNLFFSSLMILVTGNEPPLVNARNEFIKKLNNMVKVLLEKVDKPKECERQWIYEKSCLVHDFNFDGNSVAFDLYIVAQGWKLYLFGRDIGSQKYLEKLVLHSSLLEKNFKRDGSRFEIDKYDLKMDLDEIKGNLEEWMKILIEIRLLGKQ